VACLRDKTVPDTVGPFANMAHQLADRVAAGKSVAIHCRAGIGRSTTMAYRPPTRNAPVAPRRATKIDPDGTIDPYR